MGRKFTLTAGGLLALIVPLSFCLSCSASLFLSKSLYPLSYRAYYGERIQSNSRRSLGSHCISVFLCLAQSLSFSLIYINLSLSLYPLSYRAREFNLTGFWGFFLFHPVFIPPFLSRSLSVFLCVFLSPFVSLCRYTLKKSLSLISLSLSLSLSVF